MPAFEEAQLTSMRNAVWDAITNGSGTGKTVFRQFRQEEPGSRLPPGPTGYNDLPAVMVTPAKIDNQWVTQRYQDFDYFLDVTVFDTTLADAEGSWEQIWKAVIQTVDPESGLPYTRAAQGKPAALIGSTIERKRIGKEEKHTVWVSRMTFGLRTQDQPHGA